MFLETDGIWFVFKIQQCYQKIRMQIVVQREESVLTPMTLSLAEYKKYQINRHEISIKGEMYDVRSADTSGDLVTLQVIRDVDEENIIKRLANIFFGKEDSKTKNPDSSPPLHALKYFAQSSDYKSLFIFSDNMVLATPDPVFVPGEKEIPTPPPRA